MHSASGSSHSLPSPSPDVASRRLGDEVVLVHLKTNRIFSLSPTGARFWELLSDGKNRPEIETELLGEYDVSRDQVSAEIDSLVGMLQAEGLVRED
jgi:hypothetical protein